MIATYGPLIAFSAIVLALLIGLVVTKTAFRGRATLLTPKQMRELFHG